MALSLAGAVARVLQGRQAAEDRQRARQREDTLAARLAAQDAAQAEERRLRQDTALRGQRQEDELPELILAAQNGDRRALARAAVIAPNHPVITQLLIPKAPVVPPRHEIGGSLYEQKPDGSWGVVVQGKPETKVPRTQVVDGQIVDLDAATAKPIAGFVQPKKELTPAQVQANENKRVNTESKLRGDYEGNPLVKNAYGVANAVGAAKVALAQNGPIGDVMALYALVKLFDPGSVVKEGEIKLSQSANSLPDRIKLLWENTARGRKISPSMRAQMQQTIDGMVRENESLIAPVQKRFGGSARRAQADSGAVAPSPFEGMTGEGASASDIVRGTRVTPRRP